MEESSVLERSSEVALGDRAAIWPAAIWPAAICPAATRQDAAAAVEFLGVNFDCADSGTALTQILKRPADAPFAYVITPNVDHVVRLQCARSDLWPAYRHAWLTLCDSRILAKLAARARVSLPVTTGSDLTVVLFKRIVQPDDRIAIVGGDAAMIDMLRARYRLTNLVHHNPPMGFINQPAERLRTINFVVDARARFTFLAVGSPQQEILAYHIARSGEATGVALCIGASLEFLTDTKVRAPRVMQALSLEWLFRLAVEPRRLCRRYLFEGPLIFSIFRDWRRAMRT